MTNIRYGTVLELSAYLYGATFILDGIIHCQITVISEEVAVVEWKQLKKYTLLVSKDWHTQQVGSWRSWIVGTFWGGTFWALFRRRPNRWFETGSTYEAGKYIAGRTGGRASTSLCPSAASPPCHQTVPHENINFREALSTKTVKKPRQCPLRNPPKRDIYVWKLSWR